MNLTKRSKILISVVGLIAILGVIAQATGVLAAWNDKVFASATFTRGEVLKGYARSVTAHAITNRAITNGEFTATSLTYTHTSPGSATTPSQSGWTHSRSTGLLLLGTVVADGRSSATYSAGPGGNVTATAASYAKEVELWPTLLATVLNTDDSQYQASVSCTTDDWGNVVSTSAVAPSGGNFRVGLSSNSFPVPGAGGTTTINNVLAAGFRVQGTMKSIVTKTAKTALSTLVLDVDIKDAITMDVVWTVTVQFVRAECGIGEALPSVVQPVAAGAAARMARLSPSSESATQSESAETSAAESSESQSSSSEKSESESSSSASSSESGAAETPALKQGPTTPTDVDVGEQFPVIATDGTDLGTATIQKVGSTAPSDGARSTVAVKMAVTTSDTEDEGRLSSVDWDDFAAIVGGVRQAPGRAPNEGPELPDQLAPGQTYTGWVTFTAPGTAGTAMWKPEGAAGFTFVLPDPEVPVTSTTSTPAPIANAPEPGEPDVAPTEDAPAAEAPAAESEDSDPVPTPQKESRSRSSSDESSSDSSDEE
ncbi:hypothetical protein [Gordonia rubripertincta]|uniref:hypothetical protein n=1 Tax=Gordonia rubripertincta TaxID=36822 RepID=UPI0015FBF8F1|nr:hypothetical protein [Gordonia rubripertincta]QMU19256.1 hypothetical protein H3V45_14245 [Gordonia rubripertincta]